MSLDNEERGFWTSMFAHGPIGAIWMILIALILSGGSLAIYKVVAPAKEEARREVFEESKSYVHGTIRDLQNLRLEYAKASPEHKEVLKGTILHRVATFDKNELPDDLREFVEDLENEELNSNKESR